jgi:hypothetical protein
VVSVSPKEVMLTTVKRAEDGEGWILRLWETTGKAQDAEVCVLGKAVGLVNLQARQVRTIRLCRGHSGWELSSACADERPNPETPAALMTCDETGGRTQRLN